MSDQTEEPGRALAIQSGGVIRAIVPQTFDEAWRIAKAVCLAKMNPRGLDTPEMCTIAIMHGLECGLPPMMALQSIAMINGRPSIYGDGALGLVQASAKMQSIKETIDGKGDNRTATCTVIRRGDPEPKIGSFSVADAKLAKLWGKPGPWTQYPDRMLKMRARAWALRDGFSDVLKGLGVAEEVRDIPSDVPPPSQPTPPKPPERQPDPVKGPKPPQPPRPQSPIPPQPPVKEPEPEPEVQMPEPENMSLDEFLTQLDEAMATANDAQQVEDIWQGYEVEAAVGLNGMPLAIGIRRKHMRRVEQ